MDCGKVTKNENLMISSNGKCRNDGINIGVAIHDSFIEGRWLANFGSSMCIFQFEKTNTLGMMGVYYNIKPVKSQKLPLSFVSVTPNDDICGFDVSFGWNSGNDTFEGVYINGRIIGRWTPLNRQPKNLIVEKINSR